MRLAVTLALSVALTGCWGGDGESRNAELEDSVRDALAHCKLHDVRDVECRERGRYWDCRYASREKTGVMTFQGDPSGEHPEISVIC